MKWNCHLWWVSLLFLSCISSGSSRAWLQKGKTKANNVSENYETSTEMNTARMTKMRADITCVQLLAQPAREGFHLMFTESWVHTQTFTFTTRTTTNESALEYFRSALIATHAKIFLSCWCVTLERSFSSCVCVGGVHLWCGFKCIFLVVRSSLLM